MHVRIQLQPSQEQIADFMRCLNLMHTGMATAPDSPSIELQTAHYSFRRNMTMWGDVEIQRDGTFRVSIGG